MKHFDDLKYIDYVIKFTNKTDRTNELLLVCLNIMKDEPTLSIIQVLDKGLFGLGIELNNDNL
jgi:hypothetical protein